ncbi:hypothetical protein T492DRAFT_887047 [Pavlovales sp. CCMP2436]|nr:hypothetical protein T492DRAFT_887047 [Pavlovales sp. CCMP2436]
MPQTGAPSAFAPRSPFGPRRASSMRVELRETGDDAPIVVLITDPGPDPDDVKALLVLAVAHMQGAVQLKAVVANGGMQAVERAKLARCMLDHMGVLDVPVGHGSAGQPYSPQPHEYSIDDYALVDAGRLVVGERLLKQTLSAARPGSLTFVCISSLRDISDLIKADPALFVEKTRTVAIQGGLERDASHPSGWRPDSSVNNGFDLPAAEHVFAFCFEKSVPMVVTSRHAVPMMPMQSFATRTNCPVLLYLADAQFLGLEGLWRRLCAGELPARCTKQSLCFALRNGF